MKRVLVVLIFFAIGLSDTLAQQKQAVSQYMLNGLVLNPAYAGRHTHSSFTSLYRSQWVSVPGAPNLTTLTAQSGFKGRKMHIGGMLSYDQIGVHSNFNLYGSYAYVLEFYNKHKLSMGIQGGIEYLTSDFNKTTKFDTGDPNLEGTRQNIFPNFGAGLFYFSEDFYLGFSVPYILTNRKINTNDLFQNIKYSRNYYLTGGIVFPVSPSLVLKPSMLLRFEDRMPLTFDLNINAYLDEIVGVGLSYRYNDSFIAIFELRINDYFKFSYAYDVITSNINQHTFGSHELMLNYRINFAAPKRHRMCPGPNYF